MRNINNTIQDSQEAEVRFIDLIRLFYDNKVFIIIFTSFFVLLSMLIVINLPNKYTVTSIYEVNSDDANSSMSLLSGQLGSLGSLAGISLPGNSSKSDFAVTYIKSKKMLRHVLAYEGMREKLYAAKSYDPTSRKIIYDDKLFDSEKKKWVRKPKKNQDLIPSFQEIYEDIISKQLFVSVDRKSGFISVSFTHVSPVFAKEYIEVLVAELNQRIRTRDLDESQQALDFYNNKLKNSSKIEIVNSINKLIEIELKKEMLTSVKKHYIMVPIEEPFIPNKKSAPQRLLIVLLMSILGFITSLSYILIRKYVI